MIGGGECWCKDGLCSGWRGKGKTVDIEQKKSGGKVSYRGRITDKL